MSTIFLKVNGYTCIYQANTEREMQIRPEELTVTLAGYHFPRKLLLFLREHYHADIKDPYPGIYYISGFLFPIQILEIGELSKEENVWLSRLRNDLQLAEDIEPLAKGEPDGVCRVSADLLIRRFSGRQTHPAAPVLLGASVRASVLPGTFCSVLGHEYGVGH